MPSDKVNPKKNILHLIKEKYGTFAQCDLVTSPQKVNKRQNLTKHSFFLKSITVKLITNVMHQMKSLRDSFIPHKDRLRLFFIEDMSYDYKKNDK